MMKTIKMILPVLLLSASCSNSYKYWDINKFHLHPDILKNEDAVTILYSSRAPDYSPHNYFIHLVVIAEATGDTVNILTTFNNYLNEEYAEKKYRFTSMESEMGKLFRAGIDSVFAQDGTENTKRPDISVIRKVARDPKFDFIADNNYPAIIGWLGYDGDGL